MHASPATGATAANANGATVVDATRTAGPVTATSGAHDHDGWGADEPEAAGRSPPTSNARVDTGAEYEPARSPRSVTDDPPVFGSEGAFLRAQFDELRAALRAQEVIMRWQEDIQEQSEALRSTAEAMRAARV
jgi:hypothetical protein